ncbi:hypothetical protein COOONC_15249 [Cooperia oncophora]
MNILVLSTLVASACITLASSPWGYGYGYGDSGHDYHDHDHDHSYDKGYIKGFDRKAFGEFGSHKNPSLGSEYDNDNGHGGYGDEHHGRGFKYGHGPFHHDHGDHFFGHGMPNGYNKGYVHFF